MSAYSVALHAFAEVRRNLLLESQPAGAAVFLMRGTQQIPLGATPLQYEAEFHSEMSVLRFRFERIGYAPKTIEIAASQGGAMAVLDARSFLAKPESHDEERLRQMQERTNSLLAKLPDLIPETPGWQVNLGGTVRVRRLDNGIYLHIPLSIRPQGGRALTEDTKEKLLAHRVWQGVGKAVASELWPRVRSLPELSGLVLETDTATLEHRFAVTSHVESREEMVCVPGTRQVYDSCIRQAPEYRTECRGSSCSQIQSGTRCQGGYKSVYDPCEKRAPATKYDLKINPSANVDSTRNRLFFIAGRRGSAAGQDGSPAMLQIDGSGRTLFKQGDVPAGLLTGVVRQ